MDRKKINKEVVLKEAIKYFNGDEMSADVWIRKYALKDVDGNLYELTPEDMHNRLADEFHRIENKYGSPLNRQEIYDVIKDFKYIIPQGSPMAGIGNDFQFTSLSNCFVIGNKTDADSYGGILKLDQELVQLQKRRAGVGIDLSFLRPEGSVVKNSAMTSTGVVPFMERFSNSTREVAQGGRRGALMESISIKHPDAEKFIDAKMKDGKVTGANVSIKITDEFMDCVLNNKNFKQQFPIDSDNPHIVQEVDAKKLWDKIIENAWSSAEPGLLYWDTVIRESVADCYAADGFRTVSTNPCLTSDVNVMTDKGLVKIYDLIGKKFNVWVNGNLFSSSEEGFFMTGVNKEVFEIKTKKGFKIKSTDNHKFKKVIKKDRDIKEFEWCELKDLKVGDLLNLNNNRSVKWDGDGNFEVGWLIGSLLGDGTFEGETAILQYWGELKNEMKNIAIDFIVKNLKFAKDLGESKKEDKEEKVFTRIESVSLKNISEIFGVCRDKTIKEDNIISSSSEFYKGFLSGWFDADGTVNGNVEKGINLRLSSSVLENLYIAQKMLLSIGIVSTVYENRRVESKKDMPDGKGGLKEYNIKPQHELVISKDNVYIFKEEVNFLDKIKREKLEKSIENLKRGLYKEKFVDKIDSITFLGLENVYDCQIPGANEFEGNGISSHNCGEIPLCPHDSCRLLAINLYSYVENPFTDKAYFDFELFKKHVRIAQRLMDDLVDLELEKIDGILNKIESDPEDVNIKRVEHEMWEAIKEKAEVGRRTGLGITGEGDMLAALNLIYGSDESIDFSESVHKTLKLEAYRSSVEMAQERGGFKLYDTEKEKNNPFIQRIESEDPGLYGEMCKFGRRNISLLTIAPTGSVSMMTRTTGGIEPLFMPVYKRRRKINPQEKDTRVDFIDKQGDSWQEYNVFHYKFEDWLDINGYDVESVKGMNEKQVSDIVKKSPYYKATAQDIDWVKKVELQGRIQKHVDHSISVTVNLPSDIDKEMVAKVYEIGWKSGCKGITVYRDGCRDGVLVSKSSKDKKVVMGENNAPKRPKVVNADVMKFQNNFEKWVAVIGKIEINGEEVPYEIFTGKLDSFPIPSYVEHGQIIKKKMENGSVYDFKYYDKDNFEVIMSGLSRSFNKEFWNYAKLISGLLRHGMPMHHIANVVKGLSLEDGNLNTWKNGVVRILNRYVKDGTRSLNTCEYCGAQLVYSEGCLKCESCKKYSKC